TEYGLTCIHHVYEGLGFVFGFRLNSLLAPLTFGIPLLITLGLLYLYRQTSSRFVLGVFSIATTLWWVVGIGLQDGFYNHTLSVLFFIADVPLQLMRTIYPTYVPPAPTSTPTMPCDGVQFRFCPVTPGTVLYEGTGILSFVAACFLAFTVYRLIRAKQRNQPALVQALPRPIIAGVSLGLVASFAVVPLLGLFMTTGRLSFLFFALPIMGVSLLAVVMAIVWLRRTRASHPPTSPASL
ncbi:MAG TPA: hypothetical protein VH593_16305, partial [Ktedonobacteraceae bacterium]